jgi:hypothetical protein
VSAEEPFRTANLIQQAEKTESLTEKKFSAITKESLMAGVATSPIRRRPPRSSRISYPPRIPAMENPGSSRTAAPAAQDARGAVTSRASATKKKPERGRAFTIFTIDDIISGNL